MATAAAFAAALTFCANSAYAADAAAPVPAPAAGAEPAVFAHPVDPASPGAAFLAVGERLGGYAVLRADFRQEKRIKALKRPLKSTGHLLYARDHGLYWATATPFPGAMVLTPTAIAQRLDDGSYSVMRATEQPMIQAFADLMLSAFSGDPKRLATHFELYFYATGEPGTTWEIGLRPRQEQMRRAIAYLRLEGAAYATRVTVVESNGDSTIIELLEPRHLPVELTAEEAGYFAHP